MDGIAGRRAAVIELAQSPPESVTSIRDRNRERKRLERERQRPILYEREDWQLFLDRETLAQKAGCLPEELPALVLKELVDNALDAGATATITANGEKWVIGDDGPGIDPDQVAELFAVNRPLRSSKLKRLPTRGMLGNGLRVVMAWARTLIVETRGVRLTLKVDAITGRTITIRRKAIPHAPGLLVRLPLSDPDDDWLARWTLALARHGFVYTGPSLPQWYGQHDLARLFQAAPDDATAEAVIRDLGLPPPKRLQSRLAHDLAHDEVAAVLREMQRRVKPAKPDQIGRLGAIYEDFQGYAHQAGIAIEPAGGHVPYVVEAAVRCELPEKKGAGRVRYNLTLNRSRTMAQLHGASLPEYLRIEGCGLDTAVLAPTGNYTVRLSLITPHVQLTSDGKSPSLKAYEAAILAVLHKASRQAHHRAARPERAMSIKDAAWQVMPEAYAAVSSDGTLPANARQVMYAARPHLLRLTGKDTLNDQYFTQTLLPDYIENHPGVTADWDVVFDDRGTFIEPHTGRMVPLGTIAVREYLGERQRPEKPASLDAGSMFPTVGPQHRYRSVLFIEKEGFTALIDHAQIAEAFDLGIMSTKGLSVTAARMLIDRLMRSGVERVFVLHDFDVSGFSILGTLATSSRRYRFENPVHIIDLGLRLADVKAMKLQSEPSPNRSDKPDTWAKRADTLAQHGATAEEIDVLRRDRVELNAMTSAVFVQFVERKLAEHGVRKVVPDRSVLEQHARRVITRTLLNQRLDAVRPQAEADAAALALPTDLRSRVEAELRRSPHIPWDLAVADIVRQVIGVSDSGDDGT